MLLATRYHMTLFATLLFLLIANISSLSLRADLVSHHAACSTLTTCLQCLENSSCGFCSEQGAGRCMKTKKTGEALHRCNSGWIVSPLKINRIAQKDEAHTCSVLVAGKVRTHETEELFVEGELLGLVSRACIPCRGFWPKCDCSGIEVKKEISKAIPMKKSILLPNKSTLLPNATI